MTDYINVSSNISLVNDSGCYIFDGASRKDNKVEVNVINSNSTILFTNIDLAIDINFVVDKNSSLKILFLQLTSNNKIFISGKIFESSVVNVYFADFSKQILNLSTDIHLVGENAMCNWNLASLGREQDSKKFDVSIYHDYRNTHSLINNYGVARDSSKIMFSGICLIENGSHRSTAHQNAKIMVFDENSDGIAKPILKINDNEIEASHAAVVGKISDDQLFYLCSKGISLEQARQLITYGYLKPILLGFDDATKEKINNIIEGGF